jgi:hypothetical protein
VRERGNDSAGDHWAGEPLLHGLGPRYPRRGGGEDEDGRDRAEQQRAEGGAEPESPSWRALHRMAVPVIRDQLCLPLEIRGDVQRHQRPQVRQGPDLKEYLHQEHRADQRGQPLVASPPGRLSAYSADAIH